MKLTRSKRTSGRKNYKILYSASRFRSSHLYKSDISFFFLELDPIFYFWAVLEVGFGSL